MNHHERAKEGSDNKKGGMGGAGHHGETQHGLPRAMRTVKVSERAIPQTFECKFRCIVVKMKEIATCC